MKEYVFEINYDLTPKENAEIALFFSGLKYDIDMLEDKIRRFSQIGLGYERCIRLSTHKENCLITHADKPWYIENGYHPIKISKNLLDLGEIL